MDRIRILHLAAIERTFEFLFPLLELQRREGWESPAPRVTQGYLARYAAAVGSASEGAILE